MTSLPPDPYKALGVSKEAQISEIRTAYRKLVLKCHPDKVQDPALKAQKAEEFTKVQQAYELLNNEKERQRYDDQVHLQELKEQMRAKASARAAAPAATYTYNIRTAEPRPTTFKSSSPPTKSSHESFSRSYESSPRSFEETRTTPRRESSYSDKPSKSERERERERRDKEKERERRKKEKAEDSIRRAEKEAKEAKRAEKKARERAEEKERRRNGEDKKRHTAPYIEGFEDETPKSEKKRSSKKHDEKRDRSSHRGEEVPPMAPPPVPPMPQERSYTAEKEDYAASYIEAARKKNPAYSRTVAPPAPTPPPVPGQASPFSPPPIVEEADLRAPPKSRRGSSGEKSSYKKSSREVLNDPDVVYVSPSARSAQKSATAATMGSSPPRLGRQNTAPAEYAARPIPAMARSATYAGYPEDPRGRGRSRLQPQAEVEEIDSEEEYEQERRHRKHRSSKKHRSPERSGEYVSKYKVSSDGRTTLHSSYSRSMEPDPAEYAYHYTAGPTNIHVVESNRPQMPDRDASYRSAASSYPKYKVSKSYDYGDIAYSHYNGNSYQDEYPAAYA